MQLTSCSVVWLSSGTIYDAVMYLHNLFNLFKGEQYDANLIHDVVLATTFIEM